MEGNDGVIATQKKQYSGKQVIAAGESLVCLPPGSPEFNKAMDVLSYWRLCHEVPLAKAHALLEQEVLKIDRMAFIAKRLKRYESIIFKLSRFDTMKLKNMQDIGGSRVVVSSLKKVEKLVRELRRRPEFQYQGNGVRIKDYINNPKPDGYRGIHLIGKFSDGLGGDKNIEVQIRTRLQHDWATALEIIDLFTGQKLKANQGEEVWGQFFKSVSDQFAIMEGIAGFKPENMQNREQFYQIIMNNDKYLHSINRAKYASSRLDVIKKFAGFALTIGHVDGLKQGQKYGYVLVDMDTETGQVQLHFFDEADAEKAERHYIALEKKAAGNKHQVIALVSTTAIGGLSVAYPNYFADSREFIRYLLVITQSPFTPGGISYLRQMIEWFKDLPLR